MKHVPIFVKKSRSSSGVVIRKKDNMRKLQDCLVNITDNNMSEAAADQYLLKWNNHAWNFTNSFDNLLSENSLTDITIETSDRVKFKAHKVILAACSNYFYDILMHLKSSQTEPYPYIFLGDIKSTELSSILKYIYRGEVTVNKNDLNELIRIGQILDIKGLCQSAPSPDICEVRSPESSVSVICNNKTNDSKPVNDINSFVSNSSINSTDRLSYEQYLYQLHNTAYQSIPQQIQSHLYNGAFNLAATSGLSCTYASASDPSPLTKKKHSSLQHSDTILRRALDDASVAVLNAQKPSDISSTASLQESDKHNNSDPYADERKNPQKTNNGNNNGRSSVGNTKEWKRYKQYTRENIADAMNAVRQKKMSALMAAKHFCVPSRTLYDKLKKAGIIPSRNSNNNRVTSTASVVFEESARFPYPSNSPNGNIYNPRPIGPNTDIINNTNNDNSNAYSGSGSSNEAEINQTDEAMDMSNTSTNSQLSLQRNNVAGVVEDLSIKSNNTSVKREEEETEEPPRDE